MTLTQTFATLTPAQKEQFAGVKTEAALEAFASQHGIALTGEQKADAVEYFKTGILSLEDEELDNVAGGGCGGGGLTVEEAQQQAAAEGRHIIFGDVTKILCPCGAIPYRFARDSHRYSGVNAASPGIAYIDVKCYKCGATRGSLNVDNA